MQQERGGGGGIAGAGARIDQMKGLQQHDRRVKPPENQQPQQPQKCPRCESLNTKFCYYNNYSLSQPRYFCKTCRRYWTQGGTLRNVPVGGGCRKGKRSKRSYPADNLQSQLPSVTQQSSQQQQFSSAATSTSTVMTTTGSNPTLRTKGADLMIPSPMPPMAPNPSSVYYPSGGSFLSSLAALQSFNQPMNVGGDFGGSNLALLQGFSLPSFSAQQQQLFQMGARDKTIHQLLPSEENAIQQSRPSASNQEWHHQSFINPITNSIASEAGYWSSNNSNNSTSGPSLNPSQWVRPDAPENH
ncbi:PREDICTED: dof zinc finger protein DOF5.4-like isoform X2 [Nelumbo nucifera]|uniref:Dof zinc finger protein n=2 Tax=Nelumbo nucifera TaxID=4432 RepID=A0A822XPY8_NELNU|nr:PREDICTED: dof zinc finger protein DOF5.4-like isoform X2 [Nelumbo nucifera]DAD20996.1 TPA_asm: hypothetical protein HUJ06_022459 [Nelumbo nucifera]